MPEPVALLRELVARGRANVKLRYNTNLSVLPAWRDSVFDLWNQFESVQLSVSLDGLGDRGEYLRHGLKFPTAESNLRLIRQRSPRVKIVLGPTLSIFNALHIVDLHRWSIENGGFEIDEFFINILQGPEYFRVSVLGPKTCAEIAAGYEIHAKWCERQGGGAVARQWQAAARFIVSRDDSHLTGDFRRVVLDRDLATGESFLKTFPELALVLRSS